MAVAIAPAACNCETLAMVSVVLKSYEVQKKGGKKKQTDNTVQILAPITGLLGDVEIHY